jgi:AbrB family looped-hinge helix DNA binding protein
MIGSVAEEIAIDAAGRLVVPKRLRERLGLVGGSRLTVAEEDGRLILTPGRPEPRLVERDGFLVFDIGRDVPLEIGAAAPRDERLSRLVDYALRR